MNTELNSKPQINAKLVFSPEPNKPNQFLIIKVKYQRITRKWNTGRENPYA